MPAPDYEGLLVLLAHGSLESFTLFLRNPILRLTARECQKIMARVIQKDDARYLEAIRRAMRNQPFSFT